MTSATEPRRPVAVVTGASAGVGRATAIALADHGYDVGLLARGRAGLEGAAREVRAAGGRATVLQADVSDFAAVDAAATRVEDELGPIAVWVNNAMTTVFGPLDEVTPAEIERTTQVTYLGQVYGTMAALARMKPRGSGRVVNVGSSLAFVGIPLQAAYCGSKFAVRGFTQSVRAELLAEHSPVTISMVHLPAVNTPQFDWCESKMDAPARPVAPIYRPEEAAAEIIKAVDDGRRADVMGAWNRLIVALACLAPGVVAHFAARTGVDSQQGEGKSDPDRRSNLQEPVDADHDVGTHGRFGNEARGLASPDFIRSLPGVVTTLAASVSASLGDRVRQAATHLGG